MENTLSLLTYFEKIRENFDNLDVIESFTNLHEKLTYSDKIGHLDELRKEFKESGFTIEQEEPPETDGDDAGEDDGTGTGDDDGSGTGDDDGSGTGDDDGSGTGDDDGSGTGDDDGTGTGDDDGSGTGDDDGTGTGSGTGDGDGTGGGTGTGDDDGSGTGTGTGTGTGSGDSIDSGDDDSDNDDNNDDDDDKKKKKSKENESNTCSAKDMLDLSCYKNLKLLLWGLLIIVSFIIIGYLVYILNKTININNSSSQTNSVPTSNISQNIGTANAVEKIQVPESIIRKQNKPFLDRLFGWGDEKPKLSKSATKASVSLKSK